MDKPNIAFVLLMIGILTIINNQKNVVEASHKVYPKYQSVSPDVVKHLHRTRFHFQPKQNWINDPNGPMYYKGIYHLFYQYNPKGAVWGNIVWAHSVSTDMINWQPLEPAIYPSKPFDQFGCWSGSATILPGDKPIILYTGVIDQNDTQVQNYAIPANYSDPYLREWVKPDDNPLVMAGSSVNKTAFRDPTTAWFGEDGHYRIIVGSRRKERGMAYLYRSRDFKKWKRTQHPLHSSAKTGMWECPDFYPISMHSENGLETSVDNGNIRHVLKVSLDETRYEYYTIGTYCREKERYIPESIFEDGWSGLRYDYGNFYASKTFFDAGKNRRILWGWANESDSKEQDVEKGWAGIQAIPRKIWLATNGKQLLQWPIEELETLRGEKVQLSNLKLEKGENVELKGITAAQADVEAVFSFSSLDKAEPFDPSWDDMDAQQICSIKDSTVQGGLGPFGLLTLASQNLTEYTPVFFRIFKGKDNYKVLMCSDATRSSLGKGLYKPSYAGFIDADLTNKKLSLRTLIDHSVVESFGDGGKVCITSRVYPTVAITQDAHLYAFNNGTETITVESMNVWSMNTPIMN